MAREHAKAFLVLLLGAALGSAWLAAQWLAPDLQEPAWAFILGFLALGAVAQPWMPAGMAGALAAAVLAGYLVADASSTVGDEENFAGQPAPVLLFVVTAVGVLVMAALVGHAVTQAVRARLSKRPDAPRVALRDCVLAWLVLLAGGVLGAVWSMAGWPGADGAGLPPRGGALALAALVVLLGAGTQPWLPPHLAGGAVAAFLAGQMLAWLLARGPGGESIGETPAVLGAAVLLVAAACGLALAVHWLVTVARSMALRPPGPP